MQRSWPGRRGWPTGASSSSTRPGGIVWSGIYALGFYYAGSSLKGVRGPVDIGLGAAAALLVVVFLIWLRRNERRLERRAEERYPGRLADHLGPR